MTNPEFVREDHLLETNADDAVHALYEHRWHWTLDESNPDRMSMNQYAQMVGRPYNSIREHANGYAAWLKDQSMSPAEHGRRVFMGEERIAAAEVVSEVYNISMNTLRNGQWNTVVRQTLETAKAKVEEHPEVDLLTAVREVAEFGKRAREAQKQERIKLRERHGLRYVVVENQITKARNACTAALNELHRVELSDTEKGLLAESVQKLAALTHLLDMAITGTVQVDWDAELAKLNVA